MRIMLLPKLIRDEETKAHSLKNCRLVIDGQNFFYSSYRDSKLPHIFGSEANEHAKYIRKMLTMFKNANVECYVVFKGGTIDIGKKIDKLNEKFEKTVNQAELIPVFAKEVCKQVLEEVGVKYATCLFESKEDCAALAQALNCSILSNDIEYCFKGAPYIPATTLKYTPQTNQILCKQYKIEDFIKKYSINNKKLAIFATLLDTNLFEQNHFGNLLQKWNVFDQNLYLQLKKLLKWLAGQSEEEVLESISQYLINEFEKQKFFNQVEKLLETMTHDDSDVVAEYLMNYHNNDHELPISQCDPKWFEKGVATQKIAIRYIDLYTHKSIICSWVDGNKLNDSTLFSIDIIKYAYNLLTNFKATKITAYHKVNDYIKVDTESNTRKPIYQCTESIFENGWKNIKHLKLFEYFLAMNDIDAELVNELPVEARMLFITLIYFTRKKTLENIAVTKEVYCFIVSYVLLHVVFDKTDSPRQKKHKINNDDDVTARSVTKKYFVLRNGQAVDKTVLNSLYELQYCLLHMNYLNSLCGSPFMTTKYHRTFNGTFIYQLLEDMDGNNEKEFITTLFKTAPSVLAFINKLISTYENLL